MLTRFAYTCKAIYCSCWGEHLFVHHVLGVKTLHTKGLASQHHDGDALLKEEASLLPTRESATYSWPWENIGLGRYRPMYWGVWPWALLMVSEHRLYGELASQLEWLRLIIGDQLYVWNQDVLTLVVSIRDGGLQDMCADVFDDKDGLSCWLNKVADHDWHAHFQPELVRREAIRADGV